MTGARARTAAMFAAGATAAGLAALASAPWWLIPALGWLVASLTCNAWVWSTVPRMSADRTRAHATAEDGGRATRDAMILVANAGGLASVFALIAGGHSLERNSLGIIAAIGALACVASSWLLLHTVYMLRYASIYYGGGSGGRSGGDSDGIAGGIDFNQAGPPDYLDFAYFTFSIGMTYQVSDNAITGHRMRVTALQHSLLSFVFGIGLLATAINLVMALL